MCDILHLRHTKVWLRPDWLFNLTKYGKDQIRLLEIIHGLTKKVIARKKQEFKNGKRNVIDESASQNGNVKTNVKVIVKISKLKEFSKRSPSDGSSLSRVMLFSEHLCGGTFLWAGGWPERRPRCGRQRRRGEEETSLPRSVDGGRSERFHPDGRGGQGTGRHYHVRGGYATAIFREAVLFCRSLSQGHDTTAAASSFFLSMMGCHPDIQEKVIQELDDIFGDSDRPVTFQDTLEMKYLERCLMETLRMYPPVPIIARKINTDLKLGEFSLAGIITPELLNREL